MNRRDLLKSVGAAVTLPGISVSPNVLDDVRPSDLVVVSVSGPLSMEHAQKIRTSLKALWTERESPKIIVLSDGMTLRVHRGVGRVELPKG